MNEQEKEINLKRLLYRVFRGWRVAAVAVLIGAIVIGGTKFAVEMVKVHDPAVVAERQTAYEGEMALHRQKGDAILKEMEHIEAAVIQQEDYNQNSVLMKIDPYNEWIGSVGFYVETDWKVFPEQAIKPHNPANQIVRVYDTYITNGELYQYIIDGLDKPMEIRYLREVLSSSADAVNYLIQFSVRGESKDECRKILDLIEEAMHTKKTEIVQSVGTFELFATNSATYNQIDYELEQIQKENREVIKNHNTALSAKKSELLEWEKEGKKIEKPVVGTGAAVKEGIKMAILAGLIIGVVIFGFYGVGYLLSKYVQDRDEFAGWGVYVAELPKSFKKKPFAWVDRLIGKWFLGDVKANEYETRLSAAAKQMGEAAKLSFDTTEPKLTLVGDLPEEELKVLAEKMEKSATARRVNFTVAGNPVLSATAIDSILFADGVVLVAKQEYTKRETVYQTKAQVEELKKPLVAVVLTEADGII